MNSFARRITSTFGAAVVAVAFAACEGPMGPAGPDGQAGEPGQPGAPGPPGATALNTCAQCHHESAELVAIERQFKNSMHWISDVFERDGACTECHTHQGFITNVVNGEPLPARFDNPAPINCRTCHEIHTTFTDDDYALTAPGAVTLKVGLGTYNFGAAGNLCVNCHQARPISPMPTLGGNPVTLSGSRAFGYGPHYGPVGNIAAQSGLFHFPGNTTFPAANQNAHGFECSTCHMVPALGDKAGGHVFKLTSGTTQLVRACTQCHSGATSFDVGGFQTQIRAQMTTLRNLLIAEGILDPNRSPYRDYAFAGTHPADVAAAFINYKMIDEDGSLGLHNPAYVVAVLENTIAAMQARQ
jgi:hypothetical protein